MDEDTRVEWLTRLAAFLVLTHVVDGGAVKLPLPGGLDLLTRVAIWILMGAGLVFGRRLLRNPWVWLTVCVCLVSHTVFHYDRVGNHQFVLGYLALLLALACDRDPSNMWAVVAVNMRWWVVVIMLFAASQKLVNPPFADSSFIAHLFATGGLFGPVLQLLPSSWDAILENQRLIAEVNQTDPNTAAAVQLQAPLPWMAFINHGFTWLTIVLEYVLAICFAFVKNPWIRHGVMFSFVATIGLTRPEYVFGAFLAFAGVCLCPPSIKPLHRGYLVLMLVLLGVGFAR
jgi:hypothetical protein